MSSYQEKNLEKKKSYLHFGGETAFYQHSSAITQTPMSFSVFVPSGKVENAIVWLSGLTCTEENFITKAGAQQHLAKTKTMIICPDTSPRGLSLPNEHESYDFGSGAGFYLNATTQGYKDHYKMYDYIKKEIYDLLIDFFQVKKVSIMGHSMGGHGALVLGLRQPELFHCVSAFSPITNPSAVPWGKKAFEGYLGGVGSGSDIYDATELVRAGSRSNHTIFVDQGLDDEFLDGQLRVKEFEKICQDSGQALRVRFREGYDHSYYFISTFIREHIEFHLQHLEA